MPNKTTNYKLNKPLANENIDISVLNDNMDIIDAELAKKSEFSGSYDDLTNKPTIPDVSGKADATALTAHTGNSDIHVTTANKTAWNAKYAKPSSGIPKSDLASAVQTSLGKADTALQEHQDISGKADKSTTLTCTLTAAGWADNVQTVAVTGLATSGYNYIVTPASASYSDYTGAGIYADDVTAANSITFHCTDVPSSNITVNILKVQVN